ncbi:GlxA family transcriptional regulator [Halomonas sp.]|uniref:GlxA family transcriptional regulator n=1 Tax=Halomonas sp. TaxID=1486246 RepID=UPI00298DAC62|nr:helix-turn-helix domain-containing protein [Halomonas sp.]MDW7747127.1 helix-turn-helix domain-containing protein [Halomonas sp.]
MQARSDKLPRRIRIAIPTLPGSAQSAVYGLQDLFGTANRILQELQPAPEVAFAVELLPAGSTHIAPPEIAIVPPILAGNAYLNAQPELCRTLRHWHAAGTVVCSVCAGAFLLAQAGLLDGRRATTHWQLETAFRTHYPHLTLDTDALLISEADLVTAGGVMAWMDLGLHLVARHVPPSVVQALGRFLVIDTGERQQRYYRAFTPEMAHGDRAILRLQHHLHAHFTRRQTTAEMAATAGLGERTLMRRFRQATGFGPGEYLQQLRLQRARELLENRRDSVEKVALAVGYEDTSAFRKMFIKHTGLTPGQHRARFGAAHSH